MRSVAACTPLICALLLLVLHCLVRAPSLAPVDRDGAASGERLRFQPRKLLRVADAMAAAGTQPLNAAAAAAATAAGESCGVGVGVGASLKKQTPSRSNPRQN
ncbi:unnamed protein product [Miscanthus lutarioriparius]|uniref:Uncharacterized protein n=1 Tax=Miscanthus lutarioriparius TaxID=422564 RepID=A0A811RU84_9POAL|nr:unnamed protein product [Miscanthus lutarioriparius]